MLQIQMLFILVLIFAFVSASGKECGGCSSQCPEPYHTNIYTLRKPNVRPVYLEVECNKYVIVNEPFSLDEARAYCHSIGGTLANINTNRQLKKIASHIDCDRPAYIGSWQGNCFRCRFGLIYSGGSITQGEIPFDNGVVCQINQC